MSEGLIFGAGAAVFMMTVWGSVMASGIMLGRVQEAERPEKVSHSELDEQPTSVRP